MSYELYIPQAAEGRNYINGRFLKGHVPANKGKKWSEYMSKRAQRRAKKGWKNLDKYRPTTRPDTAGRCRKQVVGIFPDGTWKVFNYIGSAAEAVSGRRDNVGRCCRFNEERRVNKKTGKINTDHTYNGVRWYFESSELWQQKI